MILESALHPREFAPAKKGGYFRAFGPPLIRDVALIILACVSFIVAKSMTSHAAVNIGAFEYWILGIVPLLILNAYGYLTQLSYEQPVRLNERVVQLFCLAWILSLLLFIGARETHYYEVVRGLVLDDLHVTRRVAEVLLSAAVVLPGIFLAFGLSIMLRRKILRRAWTFSGLFVVNALMFELFVYWIG